MRILLLIPLVLVFQQAEPCPVKTVRKENWCGKCQGWRLKKDLDRKQKTCLTCRSVVERLEVCVRDYYYCRGCNKKSAKPANCIGFTCERKPMTKTTSMARTFYQCPGSCKRKGESAGKCGEQTCSNRAGRFRKTCEFSGRFPHVK